MRKFIRGACGRVFTGLLCLAFTSLTACVPNWGLEAQAGLPEYQSASLLRAGHAFVHPAGGNLSFSLPPLVVDTRLGPQSFGATYNAATRDWTFSYYDLRYDRSGFLDPTGHWNSLAYLAAYGRPIPANRFWVPLDAHRVKSAGGMVYDFDTATKRLRFVYRSSAQHPRLEIYDDRIEQCLEPNDCEVLFEIERGAAGRIIAVRDRPGPEQRRAVFGRDGNGRLVSARSAGDVEAGRSGFQLEYSLLRPGLLSASTNSEGERVEYSYDFSGRLSKLTRVGGVEATTRFYYGRVNDLSFTRIIDPLGRERVYRHDWMRQLREVTDAEGWTHRFEWSNLRLTRHETPAGVVTRWSYGPDTTTLIRPSGRPITIRSLPTAVNSEDPWRPAVLAVSDVDASGTARTLRSSVYDAAGLLSSTTDGNGDTTSFAYTDGMLSHRFSPLGNPGSGSVVTLRIAFGAHGHPTEVGTLLYGFAFTEPQTFTSAGDITTGPSIEHPEAPGRPNIARLHYDGDRNLSAIDYGACFPDPQTGACSATVTGPDEGTTTLIRRSDGRLLAVRRPLGNDTEFAYDEHGHLSERRDRIDGVWQSTSFGSDATGAVTSVTHPNGMSIEIEYNQNGWERTVRWSRPGTADMTRETLYADARPVAILDSARGGVESISYDTAGRPAAVDYPSGERMELEYDERDLETIRRFLFADTSSRTLETDYDAAGYWAERRLDGQTVAEQATIGGKRHRLAFGEGAQRVEREYFYSLSERGRRGLTVTLSALGATLEETWITRSTEVDSKLTRVAATIELAGGPVSIAEVLWEEDGDDGIGARIWGDGQTQIAPGFIVPERSYSYDAIGNRSDPGMLYNGDHTRLLSAFGRNYSFDASGYVNQIDEPTAGETTTIVRNAQGRAVEVQKTGQAPISMPLDSFGRPLAGFFGGQVELGPGGERSLELGELRLDLGNSPCHLGRYDDFRGNVRFTVDTCTGTPQKVLAYDAYGVASETGADGDDIGFAQGRQISNDLVLLGVRLYQPSTGRFLSPDPVFALGSQFAYAEGNPLSLWDRTGAQASAAEIRSASFDTVIASGATASVSLALAAVFTGTVSTVFFVAAGFAGGVMVAAYLVFLIATAVVLLQPARGVLSSRPDASRRSLTPHLMLSNVPISGPGPIAIPSFTACGLGFEVVPFILALLLLGGPIRRRPGARHLEARP